MICVILTITILTGLPTQARGIKAEALKAIPFTDVTVTGSFWKARLETNRKVTIPHNFKKCDELSLIDNFTRAAGFMPADTFQPNKNNRPSRECDVYKTIEGASYVLAKHPDVVLDLYLDSLIAKIAAAQEPDGYLYPVRGFLPPEKMERGGKERWERLGGSQELYAVGHLYEAAVAHYRATGKRTLLNVAIKNADLLCKVFGPERCEYPPGHQEVEIGLIRLYRVTGDEKYLNLAKFFIDIRGRPETHRLYGLNRQDHVPVVEQDEAVGHAVRAAYMYSGMADIAMATDHQDYVKILDRLWHDVVSTKLYVTGGVGAKSKGEAYGEAYKLGNKTAYCETCAAIANAMWSQRMFLIHGDTKYVDVVERVIYNGFLSGVSLSGDRFFYVNPLASDGNALDGTNRRNERSSWFPTPCCPTNVVRFLPSLAGYAYAQKGDRLYVNLFGGSMVRATISGNNVRLIQETEYPWDGNVKIRIEAERVQEFAIHVRIPGWARNQPVPSELYRYTRTTDEDIHLMVNNKKIEIDIQKGYTVINRKWQNGDIIELFLPMPVRYVIAHPKVTENKGKIAIERGPIVYCAEGIDNDDDLDSIKVTRNTRFNSFYEPETLSGVTVLKSSDPNIILVPYYAWAHRGKSPMNIWLLRE